MRVPSVMNLFSWFGESWVSAVCTPHRTETDVAVTHRVHGGDAALIEQSWREPEAFAGLYDRHAAVIHRYVTRRLGTGVANDFVAETFLAAFRKRHRYDLTARCRPPPCTGNSRRRWPA